METAVKVVVNDNACAFLYSTEYHPNNPAILFMTSSVLSFSLSICSWFAYLAVSKKFAKHLLGFLTTDCAVELYKLMHIACLKMLLIPSKPKLRLQELNLNQLICTKSLDAKFSVFRKIDKITLTHLNQWFPKYGSLSKQGSWRVKKWVAPK